MEKLCKRGLTEGTWHPMDYHGCLVITGQMSEADIVHFVDGMFPPRIPAQRAI